MIVYKVFHTRAADHCGLEEVCSEFESFCQAFYWAKELTKLELPTRWEFEFIDAPKQYEFHF
jgi:hypothetical protein